MRTVLSAIVGAIVVLVVTAVIGVGYLMKTGLSARSTPGSWEQRLARRVRGWSVPSSYRERTNPVARTPEAMADGMAHFADHCAICHANDGSGNTEFGKGLFPRAPDMRLAATQSMTDGELFYIIEHGIRFTGMPAWAIGTREGEEASWRLVQFIRHLPQITKRELEQMEALNPKSPEEVRQQIEEERFLEGAAPSPAQRSTPHKHPGEPHD